MAAGRGAMEWSIPRASISLCACAVVRAGGEALSVVLGLRHLEGQLKGWGATRGGK